MEDQHTKNSGGMPDMAAAILDKLTGMNAEFSFEFDNMELKLPSASGSGANIRLNGSLKIKTKGAKNLG